ncbi:protein-(glutamine-N5) methyltransferase, release factor-specific [Mycoplasma testudineum]|nr:protein-(glutamine-N5) methyltransferase, release factor-specific [Mycoplasma testudineum]
MNFPIQKIIGYIEMQNVTIDVSKKVLIPRYETEELIIKVKEHIKDNMDILDIGTGSGFIAISLAKANKSLKIDAIDIDPQAIEQCKINSIKNEIVNVNCFESNLFSNINKKYDIIVSNPPYLKLDDIVYPNLILHEPIHALIDQNGYFKIYQEIITKSKLYLKKNGFLFFEINPNDSKKFIKNNFKIIKDINNKDRIAFIQKEDLTV